MLAGCRNLFSPTFRRLCTRGNLTTQAALYTTNISTSSYHPPPTHSHSFLKSQHALLPINSSLHFSSTRCLCHIHSPGLMELKEVLQVMEQLAPLSLAESWDNVGLLVEPSKSRPIKTILLTNDLTDAVMEEAEAMSCDFIISYHPPLFRPIKRLVQKDWKQRLAIRALEAGIAIFSPHTSWDSVKGGVNDWLVGGLGKRSFWMENVPHTPTHTHHAYLMKVQDKMLWTWHCDPLVNYSDQVSSILSPEFPFPSLVSSSVF